MIIQKKLRLVLAALNSATKVADMNFPGRVLLKLKGKFEEFWSIRINGNWRLIFRFYDGSAYDVNYLDYHSVERKICSPPHPGNISKELYFKPLNITVKEVALLALRIRLCRF